jgi:hypothetical protein
MAAARWLRLCVCVCVCVCVCACVCGGDGEGEFVVVEGDDSCDVVVVVVEDWLLKSPSATKTKQDKASRIVHTPKTASMPLPSRERHEL